jgi:ankyrin repeat protein
MRALRATACGIFAWLLLDALLCAASEPSLADAAERHDVQAFGALLDKKADANAPQADGMTALHWAVHHGDADLVKRLVAAGADVKAVNRYGVTPLAIACTAGNTAIVELLLEAGADPNSALPGGETALLTASRTGRLGPVQALLARGADVVPCSGCSKPART